MDTEGEELDLEGALPDGIVGPFHVHKDEVRWETFPLGEDGINHKDRHLRAGALAVCKLFEHVVVSGQRSAVFAQGLVDDFPQH